MTSYPSIATISLSSRPIFTQRSHWGLSIGGRGRYIHLLGFLRFLSNHARDGKVFSHNTYFSLTMYTDHVLVMDRNRLWLESQWYELGGASV